MQSFIYGNFKFELVETKVRRDRDDTGLKLVESSGITINYILYIVDRSSGFIKRSHRMAS